MLTSANLRVSPHCKAPVGATAGLWLPGPVKSITARRAVQSTRFLNRDQSHHAPRYAARGPLNGAIILLVDDLVQRRRVGPFLLLV